MISYKNNKKILCVVKSILTEKCSLTHGWRQIYVSTIIFDKFSIECLALMDTCID